MATEPKLDESDASVRLAAGIQAQREQLQQAMEPFREAARQSMRASEATARAARHTSRSGEMAAVRPGKPTARATPPPASSADLSARFKALHEQHD